MRTCLGIFCGLIFLVLSSFYFFVLNLDKTVFNPNFDKQAINSSGIYLSVPGAIVEMISSGQITTAENKELPTATKEILINTINSTITPEVLKKHSESIIDQALSDKKIVTEDLTDINTSINSKIGNLVSEMFGVSVTATPSSTFVPNSYTFDKSKSPTGLAIIYHQMIIWISLGITLLFLVLLFFASADNYKSRLKWAGGFLAVAAIFSLINFAIFRLIGLDSFIKIFQENISQGWIKNISGQLGNLVSTVKMKFSFLYLYEFIILIVSTIIFFIISAILPAKQVAQTPAVTIQNNKPKETGNGPKTS